MWQYFLSYINQVIRSSNIDSDFIFEEDNEPAASPKGKLPQ
jgi:hypothetical protein